MKVTVEIDCTPEEARQFLGLPDVKPMQEAVMRTVEQRVLDAVSATTPDAMLKAWLPYMPQGAEQFQDAMMQVYRSTFGKAGGV